jgi:hypothetical protein
MPQRDRCQGDEGVPTDESISIAEFRLCNLSGLVLSTVELI